MFPQTRMMQHIIFCSAETIDGREYREYSSNQRKQEETLDLIRQSGYFIAILALKETDLFPNRTC